VQLERLARFHHLAGRVVADHLGDAARDGEQLCKVHARVVPMSSSMFTMSSVQMLPLAPGAKGQPPRPEIEPSKERNARVDPGHHVREAHAARVVEVQGVERLVGRRKLCRTWP
jgi:hypothetical protein